jgi:hypothetical protein
MLLGQMVAISVATNLFYVAILVFSASASSHSSSGSVLVAGDNESSELITRSPGEVEEVLPLALCLPIAISLVTIYLSPSVSGTPLFLPNLLAMHALIMIPLLLPARTLSHTSFSLREPPTLYLTISNVYGAVSFIAILLRARTFGESLQSLSREALHPSIFVETARKLPKALVDTFRSHPAQMSIGWDITCTSISYVAWCIIGARRTCSDEGSGPGIVKQIIGGGALLVGCGVPGVGVLAPLMLSLEPHQSGRPPAGKSVSVAKASKGNVPGNPISTSDHDESGSGEE